MLACHLQVEHYIGRLLLALSASELSIEKADLRFHQKVQLLSRPDSPLVEMGLIEGVRELNKIRNRLAHRLDASIAAGDVPAMRTFVRRSFRGRQQVPRHPQGIIEAFTLLAVAQMAGFLAAYEAAKSKDVLTGLGRRAKRAAAMQAGKAANTRVKPTTGTTDAGRGFRAIR
jgi:hypothetical protein